MPTAEEQYAAGEPMTDQIETPQTPEELAAQQLAYQLLVQQESAQPSGYPTQQLGTPIPEEVPVAPAQPQPDLSNRDAYIKAQIDLANLIRQRGEEQGGPGALQQPSPEELALKENLTQTGNQLGPGPAPQLPPSTYQMPQNQEAQAEQKAYRALRDATAKMTFRSSDELERIKNHYEQGQAQIKWRAFYNNQLSHGVPEPTARANASAAVLAMTMKTPALFGTLSRMASQTPAGPPKIMQIPGGGVALINEKTGQPTVVNRNAFPAEKFEPRSPQEVRDPVTRKIIATQVWVSPNRTQLIDKHGTELSPEIQLRINEWQVKDTDAQIAALEPKVGYGYTKAAKAAKSQIEKLKLERQTYLNNIKALGVEPARPISPSEPATPEASSPIQPTSPEVIRFTKDGRKAIFDAATKKFLRYAP